MTGIQWTDETWNPVVGCSKVSAGCEKCYAIPMAARLESMAIALEDDGKNAGRLSHYKGLAKKANGRVEWTGKVNLIPEALQIPIGWKKPRRIFVNSMSDLSGD
jgi:protein gp37